MSSVLVIHRTSIQNFTKEKLLRFLCLAVALSKNLHISSVPTYAFWLTALPFPCLNIMRLWHECSCNTSRLFLRFNFKLAIHLIRMLLQLLFEMCILDVKLEKHVYRSKKSSQKAKLDFILVSSPSPAPSTSSAPCHLSALASDPECATPSIKGQVSGLLDGECFWRVTNKEPEEDLPTQKMDHMWTSRYLVHS